MFKSKSVDIGKYLGWLEQIIDIIARLFNALMGGGSTTTTPEEPIE